jgi:imidazolonepropionase-like amidohydrolase
MKLPHLFIAVSVAALVLLLSSFLHGEPTTKKAVADNSLIAIRNVRVFDGEKTWPKATVVIREGLIESIAVDAKTPAGAKIVDGKGRTLLPGLIDSHVHSWGNARTEALRFGVTTELDMFSDHKQLSAVRAERQDIRATNRADLWSAGTLATSPGGHGTEYGMTIPTLSTPAEASAWVAARKSEGSDYIKIVREDMHTFTGKGNMATLDAATSAALIRAAHAQGLKAVVHVSALEPARESLRDGADGLAHAFGDAPADPEFVVLAKQRGAFVVPTLTVLSGFAGEHSTLPADQRIAPWLAPGQKQTLSARLAIGRPNPSLIRNARESVRRLHAAGVQVLAGTDAGNPNTAHGASMHEEMVQLVNAGLSPIESLVAATSGPARAFGLADRGRIKPGLRADLVLVDGDPAVDITATRAIVTIWKNGHAVDRSLAATAAAPRVAPGKVGDFEGNEIAAERGMKWLATTDQIAGGKSQGKLDFLAGGAEGSIGALRISGEIAAGSPWPWSGLMLVPGQRPMQPVDASGWKELVFQARGDGREYTVMLFSGSEAQSMPSMQRILPEKEWAEVRMPLASFAGVDLARLRGVAITAGLPQGHFQLDVDSVEIR